MKVIAATLLTLLAAPSTYAANTRRLGAADVSDIDNQSLSMDLIESAAVEPDYYYYEGKSGKAKSVKAVADAKAGKESSAKGEAKTAGPKGGTDAKAGKEASSKVVAAAEKASSSKAEKMSMPASAKAGKVAAASIVAAAEKASSSKAEKMSMPASAKSEKGSSEMQAAVSGASIPGGIPDGVQELIEEILAKLAGLGVEMAQADAVDPALTSNNMEGIISILEAIFGYSGSKSGKGSKSGDHDY